VLCLPSLLHTTDNHTAGPGFRVVNSFPVFMSIDFLSEVEKSVTASHIGDSVSTGNTRVMLVLT